MPPRVGDLATLYHPSEPDFWYPLIVTAVNATGDEVTLEELEKLPSTVYNGWPLVSYEGDPKRPTGRIHHAHRTDDGGYSDGTGPVLFGPERNSLIPVPRF